MYPVQPQFLLDDLKDRVCSVDRLIYTVTQKLAIPVSRLSAYLKVLVIRESILQGTYIRGYERDCSLCDLEIKKVIPEGKVKQFSLPYDLSGDHGIRIDDKVSCAHIGRSSTAPCLFSIFYNVVSLIIHGPDRKRSDLAYSCPADIDKESHFSRKHLLLGSVTSLVEACVTAFVHGSTFHHEYLIHTIRHTFGNQSRVIHYAVRKRIRNQPTAGKGMVFSHDHQRMQAGCLEAAGIQHGHIKTVSHLE